MPNERFVAYYRVGVGRQGRSRLGLEMQHRAVAEYLDDGERELGGEYTEIESGPRCDRPQLARALEACRRQKATLLIARLDRLARDASVLFDIFDHAADCDVVFCDPSQVAPARPGKFLLTQTADGADPEAGRIRRRRGVARATATGSSNGWADPASREPAPRRTSPVARRLADQRAAETLPIVRELQAAGIGTLQGMADALNARGVPTARGAQWYPTTVKNLLERDLGDGQHAAAA
jgi:DNA invertase Pin-like site-specific DNA recombinase